MTTPLNIVDNKSYTLSIFAKAGTNRNYLIFFTNLTDNREMTFFDLGNGVIANVNERHSASISDVGNDWYRCSITYTPDSSEEGFDTAWNVYFGDNESSRTVADDGGFIYLWGAQLEQRDSATAYTKTEGAPITKYQPKLMTASPDEARFDHDPITGESKGLLIEESRTNLVQDSEFIEDISTNGVWWNQTATVSSVEKNQTISPTGELNATKIIYNTNVTSGGLVMKYHTDASTGDVFTGSVYLKAGNLDKVYFYFNARASSGTSVASPAVIADLSLGVIESTVDSAGMTISDSSIDNVGNGWYRVAMTSTVITGVDVISLGIYMSGGPTNSTAAYDHLFVWGTQMEKASFPTSYIKTTGASATRSADNASITGENFSSWYRQDEGSIYSEASTSDFRSSYPRIMINDGSASNRIVVSFFGAQGLRVASNGVQYIDASNLSSSDDGNYHKRAIGLKKDSFSFYTNGESVISDHTGEMPINIDRLAFYNNLSSSPADHLSGHIKKLAYYPQRLTNEQLQNLTK
jgi:hypothetical protein